jgi:hypothetical protein
MSVEPLLSILENDPAIVINKGFCKSALSDDNVMQRKFNVEVMHLVTQANACPGSNALAYDD